MYAHIFTGFSKILNVEYTPRQKFSLFLYSFKVQKLKARKIFQKHKTESQITDLERKHVVAKNK